MRRRVTVLLSVVALMFAGAAVTSPASAAQTYTETVGGVSNTWTNYTNAGGSEGPQIGAFQPVQIACKVPGFRVADGDTWWYQIASSPWNYAYYVSADAFYNNGATSGSLHGTPFVDPAVPDCGSSSGLNETAGGVANTWTNYTNAGGTEGPQIGSQATVQIACKLTGFRVADGNTWWYEVASAPWNNGFYVSADAFYNNGATSGSLHGTPFVDPAVPDCSGSSGSGGGGGGGGTKPVNGTVINGLNVGSAQNNPHGWGAGCTVQDFKNGPLGWVIVGYSNGTNIVRGGMLFGWFDNGGGPGLGCPVNQEHLYLNGLRQDFTRGSLYWASGMNHARRVTWSDAPNPRGIWAGYVARGTDIADVHTTFVVPKASCAATHGQSNAVIWAGIDGVTAGPYLIQAGAQVHCTSSTAAPTYSLWKETNPTKPETIVGSVNRGDTVQVDIATQANGSYSINLLTNGRMVWSGTGKIAGEPLVSGECIAESPILGGTSTPSQLTDFGTVTFTSCVVRPAARDIGQQIPATATGGLGVSRYDISHDGLVHAQAALPSQTATSWSVVWKRP